MRLATSWMFVAWATLAVLMMAPSTLSKSVPNTEADVPDSLRFVQVIFRHGARTPIAVFEGDPNNDFWKEGIGQLTNKGKEGEYQLGVWLGNRYRKFIGTSVTNGTFYMRSTDKDRTLASAQLVAAGAFPPAKKDQWNDQLGQLWQPVAVHTIPVNTDPFVDMYPMNNCKRYIQLMAILPNTPEGKRVRSQHSDIDELIFKKTGQTMIDYRNFLDPCDTYHVEELNHLEVPSFIKPVRNRLMELCDYFTFYYIKTPEMVHLAGGYLVREIMDRFKDASEGKLKNLKAYLYSAHDYTSMFIQTAMRVFNYISPPFSSALILELHEKPAGHFFIKVLYRNDTNPEPHLLQIPNCDKECPLEFVRNITQCYFINDIDAACKPFSADELVQKQKDYDKYLV